MTTNNDCKGYSIFHFSCCSFYVTVNQKPKTKNTHPACFLTTCFQSLDGEELSLTGTELSSQWYGPTTTLTPNRYTHTHTHRERERERVSHNYGVYYNHTMTGRTLTTNRNRELFRCCSQSSSSSSSLSSSSSFSIRFIVAVGLLAFTIHAATTTTTSTNAAERFVVPARSSVGTTLGISDYGGGGGGDGGSSSSSSTIRELQDVPELPSAGK